MTGVSVDRTLLLRPTEAAMGDSIRAAGGDILDQVTAGLLAIPHGGGMGEGMILSLVLSRSS